MPLMPEDVVRKSFRSSRLGRGYNEDDVDAFLEEVIVELRRLNAQLDELRAEQLRGERARADVTTKAAHESEQLELIRRERQALVSDLERLQERHDALLGQVRTLESSAGAGRH